MLFGMIYSRLLVFRTFLLLYCLVSIANSSVVPHNFWPSLSTRLPCVFTPILLAGVISCSHSAPKAIRVVLTNVAQLDWEIDQINVISAYLNTEIDEDVF